MAVDAVRVQMVEKYADLVKADSKHPEQLAAMILDLERDTLRSSILTDGIRIDGRHLDEIRPITCEVGVLQRTHGSALFTRGETQSLATTTLGTEQDEQMYDNIDGVKSYSNFMLHYNFPRIVSGNG